LADPDSYLIVRLGAIGDVLRTCPAVRRLRRERPGVKIGWAVEHWVAPLLEGNTDIDRVHVLSRRELESGWGRAAREFRRFVREVRAERYSVALDFHARFKSGLVTRLSGARRRIGYAGGQVWENNHWFTNERVTLADPVENRVQRFLHLLEPLGVSAEYDPNDLGVPLTGDVRDRGREMYDAIGRPPLAVFAGTSANQAAYHRWPEEKWIELLRRLGAAGVRSAVLWGPEEADLSARIVEASDGAARLAPRTSLVEMMALAGCFRAYAGSNTAALHMAWMQGVPAAVFTGPAETRTDTPMPPVPGRALRADALVRAGVSKRHQADVTAAVPVEDVYAAVMELLEGR
jgi:heptosyltransferase I